MRAATRIAGLLGLALLAVLVLKADPAALADSVRSAGWDLCWLIPYRIIFYSLYAGGWLLLLRPYDPDGRARFGYVFWVTAVREGIDRLLPVASVGGGIVGIRLIRRRGLNAAGVGATVIAEMVSTLVAVYLFTAAGLLLLAGLRVGAQQYHRVLTVFLSTIPIPLATVLLLRHGSLFGRLHAMVRPLVGDCGLSDGAAALDSELRAAFRRHWTLLQDCALECAALLSASFEIWLALHLFGKPVTIGEAVMLESMTQAARHLAFVVPAGLGVQEAGLVLFGHALGIGTELALAVSLIKRLRELLWGIPALASWQYIEGYRLQSLPRSAH